ncbi:carbon catabolite repressor protein 4 homolog 3-like isoform X2 [Rhododendron vialii]|uniref:carbon catabolite repressor protein 4 homolog 3-like isoform X2 n=1 Tax=Rhododendron vialii TaxID=182163 RepID=UPI00265EEBB8|nr:carbon catabolite repressor protein 4 homolog 3-like isoform X2 [Rhododendron vialii]
MGCSRDAASSWLCTCPPTTTTTATSTSFKLKPFFLKPVISCSIKGPSDSTSSSSAASSYSPHRIRKFGRRLPDIVRHWVQADSLIPSDDKERFMVVPYNVLGDRNASKHKDLYRNVPSLYMNWDRRKRIICEELIGWNPDIICLQEVDRYFDLLNIMQKAGYIGSFKRRTGDSIDGCAMLWKADKFRLLECESIEFKRYNLRDNVAQHSVFEMCSAESRRLLFGNIHVLYNPSRGDVKLGQIRTLSSKAHILSKKWGNVPVILAGDYNSSPQSAIYEFLSSSQLNIMLHDRKESSGQRSCNPAQVFGIERETRNPLHLMDRIFKSGWTDEEVKVATGRAKSEVVMHPLTLNSSYATLKGSTRTRGFKSEPLATSFHAKFFGTVDYLWYSDGLLPTRVLDTLPIDVLQKTGGLPCQKLGSDHLALVSEFAFVPTEKTL